MPALGQIEQACSEPLLGSVEGRQVDQDGVNIPTLNDPLLAQDLVKGRFDNRGGHFKNFGGRLDQLLPWAAAVAFVSQFLQDVFDACLGAQL